MANVKLAWSFCLSNEDTVPPTGKVVPEPAGGKARLGINSIAHPEALARGFYTMPLDQALDFALDIFKYDYFSQIMGYNISSDLIAAKWSDLAFNASPREATLFVQRAVNTMRAQPIATDGICGANTVAAVNTYLDAPDQERLYEAILSQAAAFYQALRQKDPSKYSEALEQEWLRRLNRRPPA